MSPTTNLNPNQQVFDRVLARRAAPPDPLHGRLVHLSWSAPQQGARLVQWYVNGVWAGVSASPGDREAWLLVDAGGHQQIELLAVDPADAATPSPALLAGVDPPTAPAASALVLRDNALPIDAWLSVAVDGGEPQRTPLFAADAPRGGFGAVFGEGGFGYDASTGPGLGRGQLGDGPLGTDGDALGWRDDTLPTGAHQLRLALQTPVGDPLSAERTMDFTITRLPDPPTAVTLTADFLLTWT